MITLERANSSRRIGPWSLLGLILVPLLVAGGFLWATWDSDTRLDRVEAAVVNLDEPVTIDDQLVPLGRQLAGGLVDGEADQNFSWVLTNDTEAAEGLESGRYAAVVVIPEDFSARATSYAKTDPVEAQPATIEVQTSQVSGIADPVVGQAITAAATKALNTSLTEEYLKNIYLGFNRLGKQFTTLTKAARDLADGAGELSDGVAKTSSGSAELADGLGQLDDGAQQLASGTRELSNGTGELANGLGQLATGARSSASGAGELADGTDQLASGADKLADGADQLAGGLRSLRKGTAAQPGGTAAYADGVQDFASGLGQYQDQMAGFAQQSDEQLAAIVPCPTELPAESCPVFYAGLRAGTTVAARGLDDQGQQPGLLAGAQQLAAGADGIDAGVGKLQSGASAYADGVDQYASGVDELATGTGQLATGLDKLADGTEKSAAGAGQLASGASQLSTGTTELAGGTSQSADGARQLSNGLGQLATGAEQLATGSDKFADGLAEGRDELPSYTAAERTQLSGVVALPVESAEPETLYSDVATTTFLAVIALWLGGLVSYLVLRAVSANVLGSMKPSWRLALAALAPGAVVAAVQAVVLTVILQRLLNLSAGQVAGLLPFALLTGLAFVAVNHALVAWFGGVGRFISVILVVAAAAGAITAAVPAAFEALGPFLPLTPALHGFRAIITDGPGAAGSAGLLVAWLLLGLSAGVLAVARRRSLPADLSASQLALAR